MESAPYATRNAEGVFTIISGHHRKRAAVEAGVPKILILYDENLTQDQQRAKQIAHNALSGVDNQSILEQMASQVTDIALRYEGGLDLVMANHEENQKIENLMVDISEITDQFRAITVVFTTSKAQQVTDCVEAVKVAMNDHPDYFGAFLEPREKLLEFQAACKAVSDTLNLHNNPMIFSAMAKLAMERIAEIRETRT